MRTDSKGFRLWKPYNQYRPPALTQSRGILHRNAENKVRNKESSYEWRSWKSVAKSVEKKNWKKHSDWRLPQFPVSQSERYAYGGLQLYFCIEEYRKEIQQVPWRTFAKDNTAYIKTYVLYTISTEEHEPKEPAIYYGAFQHNDNAEPVRPCFTDRGKHGNAKPDSVVIYNEIYYDKRTKGAELWGVIRSICQKENTDKASKTGIYRCCKNLWKDNQKFSLCFYIKKDKEPEEGFPA